MLVLGQFEAATTRARLAEVDGWLAEGGGPGALVPVLAGRGNRLVGNDEAVAARSRYHQLGALRRGRRATRRPAAWHSCGPRGSGITPGVTLASANTGRGFLLVMRVAEEGLAAVAEAYARIGRTGPRIKKRGRHN